MYVQSVGTTVESQETADALTYGRDLAEEIQSFAFGFDYIQSIVFRMNNLPDQYSSGSPVLNQKSSVANNLWVVKREQETQIGKQYYASIELPSSKQILQHGQQGVIAIIRIFEQEGNEYKKIAEYSTAVLPL